MPTKTVDQMPIGFAAILTPELLGRSQAPYSLLMTYTVYKRLFNTASAWLIRDIQRSKSAGGTSDRKGSSERTRRWGR